MMLFALSVSLITGDHQILGMITRDQRPALHGPVALTVAQEVRKFDSLGDPFIDFTDFRLPLQECPLGPSRRESEKYDDMI